MSSKIRILEEQLTNMIAAGEVVERPASVVKELVENSLDAQASRIVVETRGGGKAMIRVTDDGVGMNRDDLLLALERHATSKISSADDLFAIFTMGFRGEAVPAIASVSKMKIASRERDALSGSEVSAQGGDVHDVKEAGLPKGTCIEVSSLFFNTPARRKFLRSVQVELSHVADAVTRLALPNEQVYFELIDSGNAVLRVPASKNNKERIAALLGKEVARSLIRISGEFEDFALSGFVGSPEMTRSNAGQVFFFVNKRYVRDRLVYAALRRAYERHIPKNRYPVTIIFLQIDPAMVDVNVHPSKLEVRFRNGSKIYDGIVETISKALADRFGMPRERSVFDPVPMRILRGAGKGRSTGKQGQLGWSEPTDISRNQELHLPDLTLVGSPAGESAESVDLGISREMLPSPNLHRTTRTTEIEAGDLSNATKSGPYSALEIVGQVLNTYMVCAKHDKPQSMVLIDQHAAHERILFEKLSRDYYNSSISVQNLLLPVSLDLGHSDGMVLEKIVPDLSSCGVEVEHFGGGTFRIIALPSVMGDREGRQFVLDCIERKRETGHAGVSGFADELLQLLACHSAVRAGQQLTVEQMRQILRGLDQCKMPGSCPHGRPTTKEITQDDLEKFFGRK